MKYSIYDGGILMIFDKFAMKDPLEATPETYKAVAIKYFLGIVLFFVLIFCII